MNLMLQTAHLLLRRHEQLGVSTHQHEVLHREVRDHREDHHGEGNIECRLPLPENLSMKKEEGKEDADAEVTL